MQSRPYTTQKYPVISLLPLTLSLDLNQPGALNLANNRLWQDRMQRLAIAQQKQQEQERVEPVVDLSVDEGGRDIPSA